MEILAPINEWVVVPMFEGQWADEDIRNYQRILGPPLSNSTVLTAANRAFVLSTESFGAHAFFDPTTGVSLPSAVNARTPKHICLTELADEALRRSGRLTVSYDLSRNRSLLLQDERESKLRQLADAGVAGIVYVAQAPYLIVSPEHQLVLQASDCLLAAGIPEDRIHRLR